MSTTSTADTGDIDGASYPSSGRAWGLVVLLTIAYIFSFVDRYILGLLIEPIKADIGLSDFQIGLLLGPAFAIFYATMGVPLGWAADHIRRTWIVAVGVIVWSVATIASGMSKSFGHLFLARMSVGVGEATLSPCAMSMISDSFPPQKRGLPIAFYSAALSIGAAMASLLSAAVLTWTNGIESLTIPFFGVVKPWQLTFIIVGLPGVILGLMFFTIREPKRQQATGTLVTTRKANPWDVVLYIGQRKALFATFMTLFCFLTITAYSHGWFAPMFQRVWGMPPQTYALISGILLLCFGPLSINIAGWLSDKWYSKGQQDAPLLIAMIGLLLTVPSSIAIPLMPSPYLAFAVVCVNTIGLTWLSATGVTALVNIVPSDIRGQAVAFYYMTISIVGLFLGPTSVGFLSDFVFETESLRKAMITVPMITGLPVIVLLPWIRKFYNREYNAVHLAQ